MIHKDISEHKWNRYGFCEDIFFIDIDEKLTENYH